MKNLILIVLLFTSTLSFGQLSESDKESHFAAGTIIGGISYGLVLEETQDKTIAFIASIAGAVAAGYIKETFDKTRGYGFDNNDFLATAGGGLTIGITLDILVKDNRKKNGIFRSRKRWYRGKK